MDDDSNAFGCFMVILGAVILLMVFGMGLMTNAQETQRQMQGERTEQAP